MFEAMVCYTHKNVFIISLRSVPLQDNIYRLAAATEHNLSECYHMKIYRNIIIPYEKDLRNVLSINFFVFTNEKQVTHKHMQK
jgi:hypothetical protein